VDLGWLRPVRFKENRTGSRGYIYVVDGFFLHFRHKFLSLPFSQDFFLLSPTSSSPTGVRAVEGSPTRWPTSYHGGATASGLKPLLFFLNFFLLFSYVSYPPDSVSKLKIPEKLTYDLRSRD